ncbi:UNVERIFIED_CONTAM: hypothetical protein PYX00_011266 [Menopon gallinae]|uniref:Dolichol-phosphate mannosyltransferase subunit 1 n=1 Tax=Menopon gallinae TaxID=328185 RepID=A0AAW2H721_9NEOP
MSPMYNIILPTYNEAENLERLVHMIHKEFTGMSREYRVVVVDDNSPDGTFARAEALSKTYNVTPVKRCRKLGLASAYAAGLEHCTGEYVFTMDADISHDPKYLQAFIAAQNSGCCDVVMSTRYSSEGGVYGWSFWRKMMSRGANNIAQVVLGIECTDATSGYRLYKRSVLEFLLARATSIGYSIQMEIAYLAEACSMRIAEVPIVFVDRERGRSKCGPAEVLYFLVAVLVLFARP